MELYSQLRLCDYGVSGKEPINNTVELNRLDSTLISDKLWPVHNSRWCEPQMRLELLT
jgi:hypothetical protein